MVCVGIDPDLALIPESGRTSGVEPGADPSDLLLSYFLPLIDATAPFTATYKPQFAHFAALSAEPVLESIIAYIHDNHPDIPVILDAKRGDIGSTAERYAQEAFDRYRADAVTVNPYLGWEAVEPFVRYRERGVVLLCRTSNPGSDWLQCYPPNDPAYLRVAAAAAEWNEHGNIALVAGATFPEELGQIRKLVGDMPILVPGIGAQGGDLAGVLRHGRDSAGYGLMISSSRGIIYAHHARSVGRARRLDHTIDWALAAGKAAETLQFEINELKRGQGPNVAQIGQ